MIFIIYLEYAPALQPNAFKKKYYIIPKIVENIYKSNYEEDKIHTYFLRFLMSYLSYKSLQLYKTHLILKSTHTFLR